MSEFAEAPRTNPLLTAALAYEALGFSVVPLRPRSKVPRLSECKPFQFRRASREEIIAWWTEVPQSNIGIICGDVSGGLVVFDMDTYKKDVPNLGADIEIPDGPMVESGRGGRHVYMRSDRPVRSSYPHAKLEIKSNGLLIVAPPSIHENGKPYKWIEGRGLDIGIPPAPSWVYAPLPTAESGSGLVDRAVEDLLEGFDEGMRNNAGNCLAPSSARGSRVSAGGRFPG